MFIILGNILFDVFYKTFFSQLLLKMQLMEWLLSNLYQLGVTPLWPPSYTFANSQNFLIEKILVFLSIQSEKF